MSLVDYILNPPLRWASYNIFSRSFYRFVAARCNSTPDVSFEMTQNTLTLYGGKKIFEALYLFIGGYYNMI